MSVRSGLDAGAETDTKTETKTETETRTETRTGTQANDAGDPAPGQVPSGATAGPGAGPVRGSWPREPHTVVLHHVDLPRRIPEPFAIYSESAYVQAPMEFAPHHHPLHELVWVQGGTMTVHLDEQVLTVPEGHGLWIPAGTLHAGRTTARTTLFDALFAPQRCPVTFQAVTAIDVDPLLASLLGHLQRKDLSRAARLRAEAVVFDVLQPSATHLAVRLPAEPRISVIAGALLQDPTDERTLQQWAEHIGLSERTVARLFRTHTGLSFVQWRQALRVHHAITLLAEGLPVHEVSQLMGYAQASTFIATFRRVVGVTPGAYARH